MHYETNRILLIDDNPHIRTTLPAQLDRHFHLGADKAVEGLREGASDFVIKPWHPEKLIANLKLLLRLRTLEQKAEQHKKLLSKRKKHDFLNLEEMEKLVIEKAIYVYQGNLSHAAMQLGITRATLYAKIKKYGLSSEK